MSEKASALVAQAKKWASYYGTYANGEEGAVLTVPLRVRAAWENNDANGFADIFTENGSMLIGDEQLKGREEIRSYMAAAFQGGLKGTRVTEEPVDIRPLSGDVALAVTEGGILQPGDAEVESARKARSTWVITKEAGDWRLFSLQSSPVTG